MAEVPDSLLVHRVLVTPLEGEGPYGEIWGAPVEFPAYVQMRTRYLQDPVKGAQVVLSASILCRMYMLPLTTPGSRVVLNTELGGPSSGRVSLQAPKTDGGFGAWQHLWLEVADVG